MKTLIRLLLDQIAPLGAVLSGSALFALTYLSDNLGSLQYTLSALTDLLTDVLLYIHSKLLKSCWDGQLS